MTCISLVQFRCLNRIHLLDEFCWYASPQFSVTNLCIAQHQCAGSHNGPLAHFCMVKHSCAHSYKRTVMHHTSVQRHTMSYGYVVAQYHRSLAVQRMQATVVLNVGTVSYFYEMYVAAHHSIEPNGAVIAHFHIANYHRAFAEVTMLAKSRCGHSRKSFDYSHFILYLLIINIHVISPKALSPLSAKPFLPHSGQRTIVHILWHDKRSSTLFHRPASFPV